MLARWLPTVLPAMTLTGDPTAVVTTRPFRSPPPVYGRCGADRRGQVSMPGEVSLAHHGVVCLDELPECRRHGLEVLRQPLEESVVTIANARVLERVCHPRSRPKRLVTPWTIHPHSQSSQPVKIK